MVKDESGELEVNPGKGKGKGKARLDLKMLYSSNSFTIITKVISLEI